MSYIIYDDDASWETRCLPPVSWFGINEIPFACSFTALPQLLFCWYSVKIPSSLSRLNRITFGNSSWVHSILSQRILRVACVCSLMQAIRSHNLYDVFQDPPSSDRLFSDKIQLPNSYLQLCGHVDVPSPPQTFLKPKITTVTEALILE